MTAPVPPNPSPAPDPTPDAPTPGGAPEPPPAPQGPARRRIRIPAGLLELARSLEPTWPAMLATITGPVMAEGDAGAAGAGSGDAGSGDAGGQGGSSGDAGSGDAGKGAGGEEWTPPTREEWEAQQRATAEANKKARAAERAQAERERKAAEEAGNFEELHKQSSTELERVKGLVTKAAVKDAVAEVAARLRFRNPSIAHRLIDLAGVDATLDLDGDEPSATVDAAAKGVIERRLTEVAQADQYLIGDPAAGQLAGAGANTGAGGTGNGGGSGDGNAAMNAAIRRAAGRG